MAIKDDLEDVKTKIITSYILNSDENDVKVIFDKLTRKCILSYLNNQSKVYEHYYLLIQDLMLSFSTEFNNIFDYVDYCFLKNMNNIINESIPRDFKLETIHHSYLKVGDDSNLIYNPQAMKFNERQIDYLQIVSGLFNFHAFHRLKSISHEDRENIDELYNLCSNNEDIDEDIISIVNELHDSFTSKEGRYSNEILNYYHRYLMGDKEIVEKVNNYIQKEFDFQEKLKKGGDL